MKILKLASLTLAAAFLLAIPHTSSAQVSVQIGPAPACPYGYYEVSPYNCAPDGYYGPEWFSNGVFIGAGPWYHGPEHFYGHVDHHYDFREGYRGPYPNRGEHASEHRREFHGNASHDEHGREHR
jgi:hypothetical protein